MISLSTSFRQLGLPEQFSLGAVLVLENDQSVGFQVKLVQKCEQNSFPDDPCMVYLPLFTYMWVIYGVNVGKYTMHGSSGIHETTDLRNWRQLQMLQTLELIYILDIYGNLWYHDIS